MFKEIFLPFPSSWIRDKYNSELVGFEATQRKTVSEASSLYADVKSIFFEDLSCREVWSDDHFIGAAIIFPEDLMFLTAVVGHQTFSWI